MAFLAHIEFYECTECHTWYNSSITDTERYGGVHAIFVKIEGPMGNQIQICKQCILSGLPRSAEKLYPPE